MKIKIDRDRCEVRVNNKRVHLTMKEFDILCALREADGKVLSPCELLEKIWGHPPDVASELETRKVRTHVERLRRRLGRRGEAILTVRGRGFRLIEE